MSRAKDLREIRAKLETTFGVALTDDEARDPAAVAAKVGATDAPDSVRAIALHAVRDALTTALGPLPEGVGEETRLAALFPRRLFARNKAWKRFAEDLGVRLPRLPLGNRVTAGVAMFCAGATLYFAVREALGALPPIEPWRIVVLAVMPATMLVALALHAFPRHLQSVGDVAALLVREKARTLRTSVGWSRRQVEDVVAATFATPPTRILHPMGGSWRVLAAALIAGVVAGHVAFLVVAWRVRTKFHDELRWIGTSASSWTPEYAAKWARADAGIDAVLAEALGDRDPRTRLWAFFACASAHDGERRPDLVERLLERVFDPDEVPALRIEALNLTRRWGRRKGEPFERLVGILEGDAVPSFLAQAVLANEFGRAPGFYGGPEAPEFQPRVRAQAAELRTARGRPR